jgi:hypothetical protein
MVYARNGRAYRLVVLANRYTEQKPVTDTIKKDRPPPVTEQSNPEPGLEEKLRRDPDDKDLKVDVGSDESMDASDPSSAVQPEHKEPVPSSGFPEEDDE